MKEFSFKTSKGNILQSMMRNKEQSKLIKSAVKSPLGSTSRAKARKIFSIMNKLNDNNGVGGPGFDQMQAQAPDLGPTEISAPDSKGMVIFHKIPKSNITYGKAAARPRANSDMLNDMRNFSFTSPGGVGGPGFSNFSTAWDGIKPSGMYSAPAMPAMPSGQGGPGKDGRGGWLSNAASGVSNWWNNLGSGSTNQPSYVGSGSSPSNNQSDNSGPYVGDMNFDTVRETGNLSGSPTNISSTYVPPANSPDRSNLTLEANGDNGWVENSQNAFAGYSNDIPQPNSNIGSNLNATNQPVAKPWATPNYNPSNTIGPWSTGQTISGKEAPSVANQGASGQNQNNVWQQQSPGDLPMSTMDNETPAASRADSNLSPQDLENNSVTELTNIQMVPTKNGEGVHLEAWEGTQGGQCGRFVNNYLGSSIFGDSYSQKMSMANSSTPAAGDVAIFPGGAYGHVAVVESINADGSLNIVESNVNGDEKITRRTVDAGSASGYYRPGGATNQSTAQWAAARAVSEGIGPAAFGLSQTENVMGGTLSDITSRNRTDIWDKFNIDAQSAEVHRMSLENSLLPTTITDYIKGRDEYLVKTDAEITRFIDESMKTTDMSNPINAAAANAQLNHLYTLRGRQNKSYIGYLTDAVNQHGVVLTAKTDKYTADLAAAKEMLTTANNITVAEFDNKMAAFGGMYDELKNAPMEALKKLELETRIDAAQYSAIEEATDSINQMSLLEQGAELKKLGIVWGGPDNLMIKGTDLVDVIGKLRDDPNNVNISDAGVINTYISGLKNYLNSNESDDLTAESKIEMAKEAISTLNNLASFYESGDPDLGIGPDVLSSEGVRGSALSDATTLFENLVASNIEKSGKIPEIISSIKGYAPSGWFGRRKSSPSEDDFVADFRESTGSSIRGSLDDSIARAIYATLERYKYDDGNQADSAEKAVESFLNYVNSTEDRADLQSISTSEMARILSREYITYYLNNG